MIKVTLGVMMKLKSLLFSLFIFSNCFSSFMSKDIKKDSYEERVKSFIDRLKKANNFLQQQKAFRNVSTGNLAALKKQVDQGLDLSSVPSLEGISLIHVAVSTKHDNVDILEYLNKSRL